MSAKARGAGAPTKATPDAAVVPVRVKASIAASAVTVSDRTCLPVLGVPWRSLRRFLQERGIAYQTIGRRPVVRVDVVLEALAASAPAWSEAALFAAAARKAGGK